MHFIFNLHLPSTTLYEHIFSSQSCLILMLLMCMGKWRSFISDFCTVCRNMQSKPQFKKRALTLTLLCTCWYIRINPLSAMCILPHSHSCVHVNTKVCHGKSCGIFLKIGCRASNPIKTIKAQRKNKTK